MLHEAYTAGQEAAFEKLASTAYSRWYAATKGGTPKSLSSAHKKYLELKNRRKRRGQPFSRKRLTTKRQPADVQDYIKYRGHVRKKRIKAGSPHKRITSTGIAKRPEVVAKTKKARQNSFLRLKAHAAPYKKGPSYPRLPSLPKATDRIENPFTSVKRPRKDFRKVDLIDTVETPYSLNSKLLKQNPRLTDNDISDALLRLDEQFKSTRDLHLASSPGNTIPRLTRKRRKWLKDD